MARVLMMGLHPDVVDYSKWPGLSPDGLRAGAETEIARLSAAGHTGEILWLGDLDGAEAEVATALETGAFAVVLIGAGVRKDDDHFLLFERLVNVIHARAPTARMAFNSGPGDTADAVERVLAAP